MRNALLICLAMVLQGDCLAEDPTGLVETLSQNFRGKSAMLRGFYCGSRLEYDTVGNYLGSPKSGLWTVCGFIEFKDFKLKEDKIEIRGQRTGLAFNNGKFVSIDGDSVKINLALKPDATAASLESAMNTIFYDKQTKLIDVVPDYWKCFVATPTGIDKQYKCVEPETAKGEADKPTAKIGAGVSPPKPIRVPDPDYTPLALEHKLGGTVLLGVDVNESGRIENINIVTPLGLGLDEAAIAAVKSWTFEPARRGNLPVRVHMTIEVNFHIGSNMKTLSDY
jgi:TonB family protein